jgi:RNA polymerase sigma-70 factor (ECF subfamily)
MHDTTDDERRWSGLMAAAHGGDKRAYERLLRELGTVIERYVSRHFGALMFREDCVQECLLAIHRGRHTYDPARRFRPWLFTIVRNRVIDLLRGAYAGRAVPDALAMHTQPIHPEPSEELAAGELLARLDPMQRNALLLTKVHGYSLAEAAERSGITESAMKSRVSRAVRAAAELLRQELNGG